MYATVADLRDEGIQGADERLTALLNEACSFIDHATGWFFEPREMHVRMEGRGSPSIEPAVPPIHVVAITVDGQPLDVKDVIVVGAPVVAPFDAPRITRVRGVFPRGLDNLEVSGTWGYTEADGSPVGRTPLAIRRVAMLLVVRSLARIGDAGAYRDARLAWRILEERTRDQSVRYSGMMQGVGITGDSEIDDVLALYRKPAGLGAA